MASSLDAAVDLRYYVRVLWRRKGIVLLCTVAVFSSTLITLAFIPESYEASVTLMVEERRALTRELEQIIGETGRAPAARYGEDTRLAQLSAQVQSRPFLARVVRALRMTEDQGVRQSAAALQESQPGISIDELATRMVVESLRSRIRLSSAGSGLYRITVSGFSAQNAEILAQTVSEILRQVTRQGAFAHMQEARAFGEEQRRLYEEELLQAEKNLESKRGNLIGRELVNQLVRHENLLRAETLVRRLEQETTTAHDRSALVTSEAAAAGVTLDFTALRQDPDVVTLTRRLKAALQSAINDRLSSEVDEPWPPQGNYTVLRRDLLRLLEERAREVETDEQAIELLADHTFVAVDVEVLSAAEDSLREGIAEYKRQAQTQPVDETELTRLEGEVRKKRELLESFRAQMVASAVRQAIEAAELGNRIDIVDPATRPLAPVRPQKLKILLAALLVGPALGAALALLAETMDPTLRSLQDFQRVMPEPVLCTTPLLRKLSQRSRSSVVRRYWVAASITGIIVITGLFFLSRRTIFQDSFVVGRPAQLIDSREALP